MMGRRILITGSQEWTDQEAIHAVLNDELAQTPPDTFLVVVHVGNQGADKIADTWAYDQLRRGKKVRCEQFTNSPDTLLKHGAEICHGFGDSESIGEIEQAGIPVIEHAGSQNQ